MQQLDVQNPGLPDLQFVLLVTALMTSDIDALNVPHAVRQRVFDRCWALLHDTPPPQEKAQRVLDLRQGDELTLEALIEVIRNTLSAHGVTRLTWEHSASEPTQSTTPEAQPLVDRIEKLYPFAPESRPSPEDPSEE